MFGELNTASGPFASVTGGYGSEASSELAAISGGDPNQAPGRESTVSGGSENAAEDYSSISGDEGNMTSGA